MCHRTKQTQRALLLQLSSPKSLPCVEASEQVLPKRKRQQGNILIVAVFVILVFGFLAATLMNIRWSNQNALTKEFLGAQAWLMTQSANEWALTKVYPLNTASSAVSSSCSTVISGATPTIPTVRSCKVLPMTCRLVGSLDTTPTVTTKLYKIQASAVCGTGINQVQRQQEIWIKD